MGLALSLVPLLVSGQLYGTLQPRIADQTDVSISAGSCGTALDGTVQAQITAAGICSSLQLWVTQSSTCGDAPNADSDLLLDEIPQQTLMLNRNQNLPISFAVNDLPAFASGDGGVCGEPGVDITHRLCAAVSVANDLSCFFAKQVMKPLTPVTIRYDTQPPKAPSITSLEPFENGAAVGVQANDSDTATIVIEVRAQGSDEFQVAGETTGSKSITVTGLVNGVTYEVRAYALDAAMPDQNRSGYSDVHTVTPQATDGFWDACRAAGCESGCSAAGAGPFALAALLFMTLAAHRRRR